MNAVDGPGKTNLVTAKEGNMFDLDWPAEAHDLGVDRRDTSQAPLRKGCRQQREPGPKRLGPLPFFLPLFTEVPRIGVLGRSAFQKCPKFEAWRTAGAATTTPRPSPKRSPY
jgi:hypothetical protein